MINTSFQANIRRVNPYLSILFVACIALFFIHIIYSSISDLTNTLHATTIDVAEGSLQLRARGDVYYGDTIAYKTEYVTDPTRGQRYISTTCFQDDRLVFEKSVFEGENVYLYDQPLSEYVWDGKEAQCVATLLHWHENAKYAPVRLIDSVHFTVHTRGY